MLLLFSLEISHTFTGLLFLAVCYMKGTVLSIVWEQNQLHIMEV